MQNWYVNQKPSFFEKSSPWRHFIRNNITWHDLVHRIPKCRQEIDWTIWIQQGTLVYTVAFINISWNKRRVSVGQRTWCSLHQSRYYTCREEKARPLFTKSHYSISNSCSTGSSFLSSSHHPFLRVTQWDRMWHLIERLHASFKAKQD